MDIALPSNVKSYMIYIFKLQYIINVFEERRKYKTREWFL